MKKEGKTEIKKNNANVRYYIFSDVLYTFAETVARAGVRAGCGFIRAFETS
jgi:hypothetical protein